MNRSEKDLKNMMNLYLKHDLKFKAFGLILTLFASFMTRDLFPFMSVNEEIARCIVITAIIFNRYVIKYVFKFAIGITNSIFD